MQSPLEDARSPGLSPLNGGSGSGTTHGAKTLLREQQAERERLLTDNFNMKMRIHFLEEQLLQHKRGIAFGEEDAASEVFQLRVALAEKERDYAERNNALVRATDLITKLNASLQEAQEQVKQQEREMEQQKQEVIAMQSEYVAQFQAQVNMDVAAKQREWELKAAQEITQLQDRIGRRDVTIQRLEEDKTHLQSQTEQFRQAGMQLESEVKQLRANVEQKEQEAMGWKESFERMKDEKDALDANRKQLEQRCAKLEDECNSFRNEWLRLQSDNERATRERERVAREANSAMFDKSKLQSETERLSKEINLLVQEIDSLRSQNVSLNTKCEHQHQMTEQLRSERDNLHQELVRLNGDLRSIREERDEKDATIKMLESRATNAEHETKMLRREAEMFMSRSQMTSNEQIGRLEREKQQLDQDKQRLQTQLASTERELAALEEQYAKTKEKLADEETQLKEYRERLAHCEAKLLAKSTRVDQLETQLNDMTTSSMSEVARLRRDEDQLNRLREEVARLQSQTTKERTHASELSRKVDTLQQERDAMEREFAHIRAELVTQMGGDSASMLRNQSQSIGIMVRDAITAMKNHVNANVVEMQSQWAHQSALWEEQMKQLSSKLIMCERHIDMLRRQTSQSQVQQQDIERSWLSRYEKLRVQSQTQMQSLEKKLQEEQSKATRAEATVTKLRMELDALASARTTSMAEHENEQCELRESNRLLFAEIKERRRAAEKARAQNLKLVQENKSLLAAVDLYQSTIKQQEQKIQQYESSVSKLKEKMSLSDAKQLLLQQLEQTQYMINTTYKRWKESPYGSGPMAFMMNSSTKDFSSKEAIVIQLDEYIGKMEVMTDQWQDLVNETRELQVQYGETWRSSLERAGRSDRPAWVDQLERKCSRLLSEASQLSRSLHQTVEDVVQTLQDEQDRIKVISPTNQRSPSTKPNKKLSFGDQEDNWRYRQTTKDHEVRRTSRSPPPTGRNSLSTRFSLDKSRHRASFSSLERIGQELQAIERKIKIDTHKE